MYISKASTESKVVSALKPCGPNEDGEMRVVPCFLNLITKISSVRLYFNEDLRPLDNRMEVYKRIQVLPIHFLFTLLLSIFTVILNVLQI